MNFSVYILYPNKDDLVFNKDYYLTTHLPLLEKTWKSFGLLSADAVEFGPGADGSKAPYAYGCTLTFKDQQSFGVAVTQPDSVKVQEDVAKFCNHAPVQFAGPVIARV